MTINKSQRGTFDIEGLAATAPVFSHGETYVALSSVRDFDKPTVLTPNGQTISNNIAFPQVSDKEYIDTQFANAQLAQLYLTVLTQTFHTCQQTT
jgi:hypothetical protein